MKTIVLQGDSITDVDRARENPVSMGMGYGVMTAGEMGLLYPNTFTFYNRGIAGNRVVDLYARWKRDCLNLEPDFLSILIGVNDVWQELVSHTGVGAEAFETIYSMLLSDTKAVLPKTGIMLLEPYVLPGSATEGKWDCFNREVRLRAQIVKKLAVQYQLPFVPLQSAFDEALQKAPATYWTRDGVHPTPAGHALIAKEWIRCFQQSFM